MRHLENTGLLILSGFFFLFFQKPDYTFICAFLLSVGTCCAGYFSESKKLHLFLCAAFMAAALALPEMCAFFPAVFYVLIQDHFYLPALAGCFLYLYIIRTINSNIFLFFLLGHPVLYCGIFPSVPHRIRRKAQTGFYEAAGRQHRKKSSSGRKKSYACGKAEL